jgi:lysophospholipase L1-like esterase
MHRPTAGTLALFFLAAAPVLAAEPKTADSGGFFFRPGDRIVFIGDSITEQYQYSSDIELYLTTRFPNGHMVFINAGIGGDTATGGARRFRDHVLAEKPTALTIDFGMNDGGYGDYNPQRAEQYVKNTEAMLETAKQAGVRVALISPNAVEVRSAPRLKTYLETQQRFYAPLKELASKYNVPFVDQYAVTRKVLEKLADDNAKVKPFPDGVHTSQAGGLLMAHTILTGLHAPATVSEATIDAAGGKARATGCTVSKVDGGPERLAFERTDEALPLPVLREWRDILPYVDQLKDLNYYGLKVTGLKDGRYALRIDGQEVGSYTADELAAGVNLGNLDKGPLYEQGMKVLNAINDKNKIVHQRFRGVVMFQLQTPDWLSKDLVQRVKEERQRELAKRAEQIAAKQAEVYELAKPVPHRFELSAVK